MKREMDEKEDPRTTEPRASLWAGGPGPLRGAAGPLRGAAGPLREGCGSSSHRVGLAAMLTAEDTITPN